MSLIKYSQPEFYHFSEDSILLAKLFLKEVLEEKGMLLDAGAGCGVIGFEVLNSRNNLELYSLEKQRDFFPYWKKNRAQFEGQKISWINEDLDFFCSKNKQKFDWVISNPPYFLKESSRLPKNKNTEDCRFYNQRDSKKWCYWISQLLVEGGKLFISSRSEMEIPDGLKIEKQYKKNGCLLSILLRLNKD